MARESVATLFVRAEMAWTLARRMTRAAHHRLNALDPWLGRAIPVMLAAMVGALAIGAATLAFETRHRAIDDAAIDLQLMAALLAANVNAALAAEPGEPPDRILDRIVPGRTLQHDRQILVSDAKGLIVAALPSRSAPAGSLTQWLGAGHSRVAGLEDGGVSRLRLSDGRDALAIVGLLQDPLGRVAVVQPIAGVLETWSDATWRWCTYLTISTIALFGITGTFLWQRLRAIDADKQCKSVREVIDAALDSGGCGLWNWDVGSGRVEWSNSMFTMLGLPPDRKFVMLEDIEPRLHPEDVPLNRLVEHALGLGEQRIDHSFRIRNAAGEWQWLRARASVCRPDDGRTHIIGIAVDVTEEMARAKNTQTADARLRDAIEAISEAFVVWDADNRLVVWNSKFQHFHKLPAAAMVVGTSYRDVVTQGAAPAVRNQITLSERPDRGDCTYKAQLSDSRWLQISERRTKDGGYVSVGTDITDITAHEHKLKDSERRLRDTIADLERNRLALEMQTQQLADLAERYFDQKAEAEHANNAKSAFLANMSHQLRTPLNAIIGFSEMMESQMFGALGSARYADYVTDIRKSGEYLRDVIADVLEMTSLDAGRVQLQMRCVEIGALTGETIDRIRPEAAAKSISISRRVAQGVSLLGDPGALAKVLGTLLSNAVKFTPPCGHVDVRMVRASRGINLFVADTGVGIAQEALDRLGRPFEPLSDRLDNGMKGSGLGLAIATSLARLHGGRLRVRSRIGIGTIVMVHLPLHASCPQTQSAALDNAVFRAA